MSLKQATRLLRPSQQARKELRRCLGMKQTGAGYGAMRPLLMGATAAVGAYGAYNLYKTMDVPQLEALIQPTVCAANVPEAQASVFSQTKDHALYLWIHLKPNADAKACAKAMAKLQKYVDQVCPADMRDEDDEIWAGVGFGPNFFSQIGGKPQADYHYPHRKGIHGEMPSTGGDIFIHAKSNQVSKLFELGQEILKNLPADSVEKFEDIYSFVYKNGRDLSGFIDGTENTADDDDRKDVAVEKATGGSYVITQKWVHDLKLIGSEKERNMEGWLGRTRPDSTELSRKTITSHVARMTGGSGWQQKKPVEIVRQSMPYGNLHDGAGLFFIGYAASPQNFEFMLSNMVGAGVDGHHDDVMRLSKCVAGTYWYMPSQQELAKLA